MITVRVGHRVRALLTSAKGSYSVDAVIQAAFPDALEMELVASTRVIVVPAANISSIEVLDAVEGVSSSHPGRLPLRMEILLDSVSRIFKTGSGAVVKSVNLPQTESAVGEVAALGEELATANARQIVLKIQQTLDSLRLAQTLSQYDAIEREVQSVDSNIRECMDILSQYTESERLRLVSVDLLSRISTVTERYWKSYQANLEPRPRFQTFSEPIVVSVAGSGEAHVTLRINLEDAFAPARSLEVLVDELKGVSFLGAKPTLDEILPGQNIPIKLLAQVDASVHMDDATVRLRVQLRYRQPDLSERMSPKQNIDLRLQFPRPFSPLANPYSAYSGGTTVADSSMFFGRGSLIEEAVEQLRTGPLGQCYAIFGQKRSGKSSVLEQARRALDDRPIVPVFISLGTIDRRELTSSFVGEFLEQVRVPLLTQLSGDDYKRLSYLWPSPDRIEQRPLESLRTSLTAGRKLLSKYEGWAGLRYVLLIDEFTYLFEVLRRGGTTEAEFASVRDFMRQWKALLEGQFFSAIVVGQDTMPEFMRRFPNEFSSMNSRRLGYLTADETHDLATKPVSTGDGSSRYLGYAAHTIFGYTDGHPFFTQIVCDRLVRLANRKKRGEFTEGDVLEAVQSLTSGSEAMDFYRFDCLLTADNTGLLAAEVSEPEDDDFYDDGGEAAFQLLYRIASLAGEQNRPVPIDSLDLDTEEQLVCADLVRREVLEVRADSARIRVLLFADYLRRM